MEAQARTGGRVLEPRRRTATWVAQEEDLGILGTVGVASRAIQPNTPGIAR